MILASHGIISSGGGAAFDSDYQAVLNYATSLGYTLPSASQQIKQNQLMLDLKAAGVWNKLDTLRVYATDGSANFALIDWKRLVLCTAVNSPTFTANQGFKGDGLSSYIDTNFNPNTSTGLSNYKLTNASSGIWVTTQAILGTGGLKGTIAGSSLRFIQGSSTAHRINSNAVAYSVDLSGSGLKVANKTASNTSSFWNNTTNTSGTGGSDINTNANVLDMRFATSYYSETVSLGFEGASLNSEHTSLYNAFNTYMSSL